MSEMHVCRHWIWLGLGFGIGVDIPTGGHLDDFQMTCGIEKAIGNKLSAKSDLRG